MYSPIKGTALHTKQRLLAATLSALLSLGIVATAFGDPPFVTDDPQPVDYQNWEFYIASMHSDLGGDWSATAPQFEVNYGAVPNLQLHLMVPLAYDSPPAGAAHYEVGDIELGAKYRFIQETNGGPRWGFFHCLKCRPAAQRTISAMAMFRPVSPYGCRRVGVRGPPTVGVATASVLFPDTTIGVLSGRCCKGRC